MEASCSVVEDIVLPPLPCIPFMFLELLEICVSLSHLDHSQLQIVGNTLLTKSLQLALKMKIFESFNEAGALLLGPSFSPLILV